MITIKKVRMVLPVDGHPDNNIPENFPGLINNFWEGVIDVDTGQLENLEDSDEVRGIALIVGDKGYYEIQGQDGAVLASNYYPVPAFIPRVSAGHVLLLLQGNKVVNWEKNNDAMLSFISSNS